MQNVSSIRCITMAFIYKISSKWLTLLIYLREAAKCFLIEYWKSHSTQKVFRMPFLKTKMFGLINSWKCWVFSSTKSHIFSQYFCNQMVTIMSLIVWYFFPPPYICDTEIHAITYFAFVLLTSYIQKPTN